MCNLPGSEHRPPKPSATSARGTRGDTAVLQQNYINSASRDGENTSSTSGCKELFGHRSTSEVRR